MTPPRRKLWLDWQRGLAVLFMIEVHVLDAWLASDARSGAAYHALRMLGGFAAPGFLYMAGLSQALADGAARAEGRSGRRAAHRGAPARALAPRRRVRVPRRRVPLGGAWRRAGGWTDLLSVDVLNVIAVGLVLSALLVGRPARPDGRAARRGGGARDGARDARSSPTCSATTTCLAGRVAAEARDRRRTGSWTSSSPTSTRAGRAPTSTCSTGSGSSSRARPSRRSRAASGGRGSGSGPPRRCSRSAPGRTAGRPSTRTSTSGGPRPPGSPCGSRSASGSPARCSSCRTQPSAGSGGSRCSAGSLSSAYIASVELTYGALASPLKGALSFPATVFGISAMAALTWAISLAWERYRARRRRAGGQRGPGGAGTPLSRAGS